MFVEKDISEKVRFSSWLMSAHYIPVLLDTIILLMTIKKIFGDSLQSCLALVLTTKTHNSLYGSTSGFLAQMLNNLRFQGKPVMIYEFPDGWSRFCLICFILSNMVTVLKEGGHNPIKFETENWSINSCWVDVSTFFYVMHELLFLICCDFNLQILFFYMSMYFFKHTSAHFFLFFIFFILTLMSLSPQQSLPYIKVGRSLARHSLS